MIHTLPSTLLQQQSFIPDWIKGDIADLPAGLIVSIQITTSSLSDIYLKSIVFSNDELQISFEQNGKICAYGTFSKDSYIVSLQTKDAVYSCTIEFGIFPATEFSLIFKNAYIDRYYVNVISDINPCSNYLEIKNNQQESVIQLENNLEIELQGCLEGEYDNENKTLRISMPDECYTDFKQLGNSVIKPSNYLTAINGISSNTGVIYVNITYKGKPLKIDSVSPNWVEINEPDISICPDYEDELDNYISPFNHIEYRPLDDLYTEEGVRNCDKASEFLYGGLGGVGEPVGLFDIDTNIDKQEEESEGGSN